MSRGFWRKNGVSRGVRILATTHFTPVWHALRATPRVSDLVNRWLINSLIYTMKTRPGALSTMQPWTSWESLHDRTFSQRHLPPDPEFAAGLPAAAEVATVFARPGAQCPESAKSTLLFPLFAQWFVDGFLRTDPEDDCKNTSTHDIDLSQLYGQTPAVTRMLRTGVGGRLRTEPTLDAEFPPYLCGADGTIKPEFGDLDIEFRGRDVKVERGGPVPDALRSTLFALGIPRGNIHYGFVMLSTLFLREHNRIAGVIAAEHPDWSDDRVFDTTRNTLTAVLLNIVIEDYINHITPIKFPLFVKPGIGARERWYRQNWMSVEFNLLYRWHSLVPTEVTVGGQRKRFADMWWDTRPVTEHGLAALFDEASRQPCSTISLGNTDPSLLSIEEKSIAIGRDTALQPYNAYREACGFPRLQSVDDLTSDTRTRAALKRCYGDDGIDRVELFVGLFAEDVRRGSTLPALMSAMVAVDAFSQALTNPLLDPAVYGEATFSAAGLRVVETTKTLSDVVRRNTAGEARAPRVSLGRRRWR
ncbi:peroxide synthase [Mycolicibacterium sp. 018/SC-01/001]|uniref:peroxidase family protein n=1 Tax=Mycolicibacterium sp. 018/SC-01/001 TaxID=2592069 RepID=UPI00117C252B|nr:peroxidase family protein [Mycolicibacterium sp. 018/SC-01/001]TRW82386.1 peroxide synthase [Mycolicibacterium sp. 018/SC-01/001]